MYNTPAYLIALILFAVLLAVFVLGLRIRKRFDRRGLSNEATELGTVEGSLLALFAFFLGFTFNMAGNRFDNRRQTIVVEANAISTAILRADVYPDSIRKLMREDFERYVDCRIEYFEAGVNRSKINSSMKRGDSVASSLWDRATAFSHDSRYSDATRLMIPALNDMIDAAAARDATKNATIPESIIWVLFALGSFSSFIIGYSTSSKKLNYVSGFIFLVMVCISVYLIIDLDRPRRGLINLQESNNNILDLKKMFYSDADNL